MNGQDINSAIMDKQTGTAAIVLKMYPPRDVATTRRAMDILFKACSTGRPPARN